MDFEALRCVALERETEAHPRIQELLRSLADSTVSVHLVPDFFVFDLLHGRWSSVGDLPVVSIFESPFYGIDGAVKRLEDLVLGPVDGDC